EAKNPGRFGRPDVRLRYRTDRVTRSSVGPRIRLGLVALSCVLPWITGAAAAQPAGDDPDTPAEEVTAPDDAPTPASEPAPAAAAAQATPASPPGPTHEADATVASSIQLGDVIAEPSKFSFEPFGYLRMQYIAVQNDPNVAH